MIRTPSPRSSIILFATLVFSLAGCRQSGAPDAAAPAADNDEAAVVYTTFYPTTFIAERIGAGVVEVVNPVPADADPIFFEPTPEIINAYQKADLIIVNGASFEKWVAQAPLPRSRIVDTAADFSDAFLTYEGATHSHGPAGEHTHEGIDGHTWLDPQLATRQADAIRDAFAKKWPAHAAVFDTNYRELRERLAGLDLLFASVTDLLGDVTLLANHPAYNYLARRYGWTIINLDVDPESTDADAVVGLVEAEIGAPTPGAGRRIMLWEAPPTDVVADALEQRLAVTSVEFAPAESLDADAADAGAHYLSIMRDNIERLMAAASP